MTQEKPQIDYERELQRLREIYSLAIPQARLNTITQRLASPDAGAARLVTIVSAVEALARSLATHSHADAAAAYARYKKREAPALVEDVLHQRGKPRAAATFPGDTWRLFKAAVNYRNLVVHECTFLGQDKYPSLIGAAEEVLTLLIAIGQLRDPRARPPREAP